MYREYMLVEEIPEIYSVSSNLEERTFYLSPLKAAKQFVDDEIAEMWRIALKNSRPSKAWPRWSSRTKKYAAG
jgi:hypothetical protein